MVAAMAFQVLPNVAVALVAALAMILTRCVPVDGIYRVISWRTLVVIAGMLPLATALTKTGATTMMADALVRNPGLAGADPDAGDGVRGDCAGLSGHLQCRNRGSARPCRGRGRTDPSCLPAGICNDGGDRLFQVAFVTPVSSPTNMLVMEPGGYRFSDYAKVGLPCWS